MPEFVGFQTIGIPVPYCITFDAVGVFGLVFYFYLNLAHHTVTVHKGAETIQGRKLYEEIRYIAHPIRF